MKIKTWNSTYLDHCAKLNLMPTEEGYKEWINNKIKKVKK